MSVFYRFRPILNQTLSTSVVAILCILAIGALQKPNLNYLKSKSSNTSPQEMQTEVDRENLRLNLFKQLPAFGYNNLLSNWVFLQFLQYFGDDPAREVTGYRLSPEYFEVILDRDPRFLEAYFFLSTSASLYAGMPDRSVALIEKASKSISPQVPQKSYYIWRYKATDELLFLGNTEAAKQSFNQAAEWASYYSDPESQYVGSISRQTAEFLAKNPNSKSAQINAWSMVLENAFDQRTRKEAINRIEALGGKVIITPEGKIEKILKPEQD